MTESNEFDESTYVKDSLKDFEELQIKMRNKILTKERKAKAKRQLDNESFRHKVFEKYNDRCAECKSKGGEYYPSKDGKARKNYLAIHHKNYNWECEYEKEEKIKCSECYIFEKENFDKCLKNCILLCNRCHYKTHMNLLRKTGQWI